MQPDLNRLAQSPYKYASAVIPDVQPFLPVYAHLTSGSLKDSLANYEAHCRDNLDLGQFLKEASLPAIESLAKLFHSRPKLAQAFDNWYGLDTLSTAIKNAGVRLRGPSILDEKRSAPIYRTGSIANDLEKSASDGDKGPKANQKLKVITWDESRPDGPPEGLDEEDAAKLLNDHLLIQDHRTGDEVSVAYNVDVPSKLTNPHETGVYMVLTKPGDFEKCLVVVDPHGPNERKHFCTIIRMDESTRNWGNYPKDDVWVAGQIEELIPGGEESWQEFFEDLPEAKSFEKGDGRYVLIGPRRNATCPFKIKESLGVNGTQVYEVGMACDCHYGRHLSKGLHRFKDTADYEWFDEYDQYEDGCRIHLDSKIGTDLRSNNGDIFVPKGYKVLKLSPTKADSDMKSIKPNEVVSWGPDHDKQSDPPPIMPGNIIDAELSIMNKTAELKIAYDGFTYAVNSRSLRPQEAIVHLVRDHGLRQEMGEHLLKQAETQYRRTRGKAFECRIKYAFPYLTEQGPSAPAFPEPQMGGNNMMGFPGNLGRRGTSNHPPPGHPCRRRLDPRTPRSKTFGCLPTSAPPKPNTTSTSRSSSSAPVWTT